MQKNRLVVFEAHEESEPDSGEVLQWCEALEACERRFIELGVESEALMRDALASVACGHCVCIDSRAGIVMEISQEVVKW